MTEGAYPVKTSRALLACALTVVAAVATFAAGGGPAAAGPSESVSSPSLGVGTGANNAPNPLALRTGMTGTSQYSMTDPTIPGLSCADYATNITFTNSVNVWGTGDPLDEETACVDAMFAAQTEARMVSQWLGRNGLDGAGGAWPIKIGLPAEAPAGADYFDSGRVLIGHKPAVGYEIPAWLTTLPVVAHEFGHGIDSSTRGTSGNSTREFIADAFGAATNFFANEPAPYAPNFVIAGISMNSSACYDSSTESPTLDSHEAAKVGDHWFYLVAEGTNPTDGQPTSPTCNNNTVSGGGIQQAIKILYNAMLMKTSASSYPSYRTWTLTAAKNLTPGDCTAFNRTRAAWDAVSVPAQPGDPICVIAVNRVPFGVADWDGDGHTDVIARNNSTGDVWLYPGPGTRGPLEAAPVVIGVGWGGFTPFGVADYNGDGHMDIIARQDFYYAGDGTPAGSLWMYPGAGGRGPLNQSARVQIGNGWTGFTPFGVVDWDSDGHADIIARNDFAFAGYATGSLFKYPGNGGALDQNARVLIDTNWSGYTPFGLGDYNGDGHPDIIARNDTAAYLALMPGNGGHLTTQTTIGTGWGGYTPFGVADWDSDRHPDVIARQDFSDSAAVAGTLVAFVQFGGRVAVATSAPVAVPNLIGLTLAQAGAALSAVGLVLGNETDLVMGDCNCRVVAEGGHADDGRAADPGVGAGPDAALGGSDQRLHLDCGLATAAFGGVGFADDYLKITRHSHHGLIPRYKMGAQVASALAVGCVLMLLAQPRTLQHAADISVLQVADPGSGLVLRALRGRSCSSARQRSEPHRRPRRAGHQHVRDRRRGVHGARLRHGSPRAGGVPAAGAFPAGRGADDLLRRARRREPGFLW